MLLPLCFPRFERYGRTACARLIAVAFCVGAGLASAATRDGDLQMEVITAYNLVVDSNVETPASYCPRAAYLGVRITNTSTTTAMTDIYVRMGNLTDPATGAGTPGVYPVTSVAEGAGWGYWGDFSLTHEGGILDATRYIASLAPGASKVVYWLVSYPLLDANGKTVTGATRLVEDDLRLDYDVWVQAMEGAVTPRLAYDERHVTCRKEISAMANKIWPNTTSKVPDQYLAAIQETLGWRPGTEPRTPGAIVTEGIWYDLGNVGFGFDNDGDLLPDRNAWMQPVGDPSLFDASALRLAKCYGIVIVKLNDGTEQLIPFEDNMYFSHIPENNTGAVGLVYYEFMPLEAGASATLTPYQEVASGYNNEKFNGDYGASFSVGTAPDASISIEKTGPATIAPGGQITYTVLVTNTSTTTVFGNPEVGLPAAVSDAIPAGTTYVQDSAAVSGLQNGNTVQIRYSTDGGTTWTTTQPGSGVTDLQWLFANAMQPLESATVTFQVTAPSSGIRVDNTAGFGLDSVPPLVTDSLATLISGINSIGDFVWRDLNRDGVQDGGAETGIADITVSLYVDSNGNGTLDTGEPLHSTASTDANGAYLFSALPDNTYIVVADSVDPDLPYGFTLKDGVSDRFAVDLDAGGTDPAAVDFLTADWPFIQALDITKTVSPTTCNEGGLVTYTIDLDNHMSALQVSAAALQTAYITGATQPANTGGAAVTNNVTGAPDSAYGFIDWQANSDTITSTTLATFPGATGTITQVELIVRGYMSRALVNDQLDVLIGHSSTAPALFTTLTTAQLNATVGVPQDIVVDITSKVAGTWSWAQAQSLVVALDSNKTSNGDVGDYYIDSIGFRVTTDNVPFTGTYGDSTILELPLVDTYDPTKLQFVSASITPDRTTPAGTLEWDNLGPVNPGVRKTVTVTFRALAPSDTDSDGQRDPMTATNTVSTEGMSTGFVPTFASGLPAGHDTSAVDVTINPAGTVGDLVFWDVDGSGGFNSGDVEIKGVTVVLYQDSGSGFEFTGRTVFTDSNGYYAFAGLADGTYRTQIVTDTANDLFTLPWTSFTTTAIPAGGSTAAPYVVGASVVINNSNTSLTDDSNFLQDFGFDTSTSTISGTLFMDYDGDGVQDPGEEPLADYTMNLTGGTTGSVVTDTVGFYRFSNITATGSHTVTVASPPANTTQTLDPDATLNSNTVVDVAAGAAYPDRDFAYRPSGSLTIGDTLYYDWNGNETQDAGELGIPSVTVHLYEDANSDGEVNPDEDALIATQVTGDGTTDVDGDSVVDLVGFYRFRNLAAGSYIVAVDTADEDFPALHVATEDYDGVKDDQAEVALSVSLGTVDFGYQPIGTASIGNLVWLDGDNDGLKGSGESGIDGVTVELYRSDQTPGTDTPQASTITASGGIYSFSSLPAGNWMVYLPEANFTGAGALVATPLSSTTTGETDDTTDNDDNGIQTGGESTAVSSPVIALTAGEADTTKDFGFVGLGSIGDFVFWDANDNGTQDAGEPGIPGITVELYLDTDGNGTPDGSAIAATTTADGSIAGTPKGSYQFADLAPSQPGQYYVVKVLASTMTQTADPDRDGEGRSSTLSGLPAFDNMDSGIFLGTSSYTGADFGYLPSGVIGDFVWLDQDADGVQDNGEAGIAGVTVFLDSNTDGVLDWTDGNSNGTWDAGEGEQWTTTDNDGYYSVANLADGTYAVTLAGTPVDSKVPTFDADGTGTPNTTGVTLAGGTIASPGTDPLAVDFGLKLDGDYSISGTICINDSRTSGICDDVDNFLDDGVDMDAGPTDETELEGVAVYLFASSGGLLATAVTDAAGNYTFDGLPAGDYRIAIDTTAAPLDQASLTTTVDDTPATALTSNGTSVIQDVTVTAADVTDVDFAFVSNLDPDFGDLPASYAMTTLAQNGACHIIPDGGATTYLGTAPDDDGNGVPSAFADSDDLSGSDDEDGVVPAPAKPVGAWTDGTVATGNGGALQVTVTVPSGETAYLVGWIDWDHDNTFLDTGEVVISAAVGAGADQVLVYTFDIPAGTVDGTDESWLSRFRLFTEEPALPQFAYTGEATDGEVEDYLFSYTSGGGIGDRVWVDTDGDGIQDAGECGLAGVTVALKDSGGTLITTRTTSDGTQDVDGDGVVDPVGFYRFTGLGAADYTVDIGLPTGYTHSYDEDGGDDGTADVVLAADTQHLTADFGLEPLPADISGTVYMDTTDDNDFSVDDAPIMSVTIQLWTDPDGDGDTGDGIQVGETQTDANGDYLFADVYSGNYVLVETDPSGVFSVKDTDGDNDNRIRVPLAGVDSTGNDFLDEGGLLLHISGTVFEDGGNDVFGGDDTPITTVTVELFIDADGNGVYDATDPFVTSTVTDGSGQYVFAGLPPGKYVVRETDPDGMASVDDTSTDTVGTDNLIGVTLTTADSPGNDFLDSLGPGSIAGQVRRDIDGDGDLSDDEYARVGIQIQLWTDPNGDGDPADGAQVATMNTDDNGSYLFSDLAAGNYVVVENDTGGGYTSTNDADGGTDEASWNSVAVTLADGEQLTAKDFLDKPDTPPTAAVISEVRIVRFGTSLALEWQTAAETATAGFHVYRIRDEEPGRERLTPFAILRSGSPAGGTYRVIDPALHEGDDPTYLIEEISTNGNRHMYGPYRPNVPGEREIAGCTPRNPDLCLFAGEPRPIPPEYSRRLDRRPAPLASIPTHNPAGDRNAALQQPLLRIEVRENGMYRIPAADIADALKFAPADMPEILSTGQVALRSRGRQTAYSFSETGNALIFFGEKHATAYADHNVYWLSAQPGRIMDSIDCHRPEPTASSIFLDVAVEERDKQAVFDAGALTDDIWVWATLASGNPAFAGRTFNVTLTDVASGENGAGIVAHLLGGNETPADVDHLAEIAVNGTAVGIASGDGRQRFAGEFTFPATILRQGLNTVTVTARKADGVENSLVYLDRIEVVYPRACRAVQDRLSFSTEADGPVTVGGFRSPDVRVFDVTASETPVELTGCTVTGDGAQYSVTLTPLTDAARCVATTVQAMPVPAGLQTVNGIALTSPEIAADYVIITTPEMTQAAQRLADYRTTQGLQALVVTVDDIARECADGLIGPQAIRRFLALAYRRWLIPPKYVVLAGEGTYDYRNVKQMDDNLIPPMLIATSFGFATSDIAFGDVVSDDGIPEIAVGRLPVANAAELNTVIDKLIAYEEAPEDGWQNTMVLAADAPDEGGDFSVDGEQTIAADAEAYTITRVLLADTAMDLAREQLRDAISEGTAFVTYIGHGGYDRFARGGLLTETDVPQLNNGCRLPVVIAATCLSGHYGVPGRDCLAETLVRSSAGGAVAFWAPSTLAFNAESSALAEGFHRAVAEGNSRLGDVINAAMKAHALATESEPICAAARRTFNLIGDPATALRTATR